MIALITGGAEGIGKGLAEECAVRGYDVIIASLPNDALDNTIKEFEEKYPNLTFYKYGVDFLEDDAVKNLLKWTEENNLSLDVLINNVGLGNVGPFDSADLSFYELMIKLNAISTTRMCHAFLPQLKKAKAPLLINVSSFAGTVPVPNKAIYSATKGFVLNLTLSIRQELKPFNVKVSALCPGAIITNPEVQKRIEAAGYLSSKSALYPRELARKAFKQALRGKPVIIPGKLNMIFRFLLRTLPLDIRNHLMSKAFK